MRNYGRFLRRPHAARLLGGTLVGRLPTGMALLAIPLYVRELGGGYTLGGLLLGIYTISMSIGQPILGRAMDRYGQPWILAGTALAAGAGFAIFAAIGLRAFPVTVAAVVLAGAGTPPLEAGLRALWPTVLGDPDEVQAAYSIDAAAQELLFVAGPLLVSAAAIAFPEAALLLMAMLGGLGTLVVGSSSASRRWRGRINTDWAGPLRSPGLRVLTLVLFFLGGSLGPYAIAALAYAGERGLPFAESLLLAVHPLGALTGGLIYGSRRWDGPGGRRFCLLAAGLAAGYVPLILVPGLPVMLGLAVLSGVFLAPALACTFTLVDELAPRGTVTEAFAWVVTAMTAGGGLGSAAAGVAGDLAGAPGAFACSATAGLIGLAVALLGRRAFQPAPVITTRASGW